MEVFLGCILGGLPLLWLLLWWWNEILYVFPLNFRDSGDGAKLPPGSMGLPYFGELFTFLWYFKILRRPDDFINSKRNKYGDGVGLYKTYLFGSPSIIACSPMVNKFILQDDKFILEWPNKDVIGPNSIVAVQGKAHSRLKSFVSNSINRPDALRLIAAHVQPHIVAALNSWAQAGKIKAYKEIKKVNFENIGKLFASFEPGPKLDTMDELFNGLIKGVRALRLNFPGTAYHHALQCREKLEAMFGEELEKKKKKQKESGIETRNDLMDGLMQMKDEEGNKMSDQEVIENILGLVIGGYETTSLASMWAFYYLPKYPQVLEKLREENVAMSKEKNGDFLTIEDVSQLKYTNKVVEETIRLANISAFSFRLATEDVEYKGYKIPKNWKVITWARYIHTNPEIYEDPLYFNPERWNNPARPGTFQAFGGGSRICAGNRLARTQLAILMHHLSVGYKWELVNPDAEITYLPHQKPADGVEVAFSKI